MHLFLGSGNSFALDLLTAVPRWTDERTDAIRARNRAFRLFRALSTGKKETEFKHLQARVQRNINEAKRSSWQALISSFSSLDDQMSCN